MASTNSFSFPVFLYNGQAVAQKKYIGLDLGGSKIACAVVSEGKVLFKVRERTEKEAGPERILEQMRQMVMRCLKADPDVSGIGISAAGPIDFQRQELVAPPNLPHRGTIKVVEPFKEMALPVKMENDANCAAIAEYLYGSGRECHDFVYMTISTGVGGGVILNGRLYRGASGNAGEIGHVIIHPGGRRCGCGSQGCLEAYCSGTALVRIAEEEVKMHKTSLLYGLYKQRTMDAKTIFDAVEQKDSFALSLLKTFTENLSLGIASIATTLNPRKVILGGGIGSRADLYLHEVEQKVKSHLMRPLREVFEMAKAKHLLDTGVIGAASLFTFQ